MTAPSYFLDVFHVNSEETIKKAKFAQEYFPRKTIYIKRLSTSRRDKYLKGVFMRGNARYKEANAIDFCTRISQICSKEANLKVKIALIS